MLNKKYTSLAIIVGLTVVLICNQTNNKWIEIFGNSLCLLATILSKQKIVEENKDYGIHIYYTLMILWLLLIFIDWF